MERLLILYFSITGDVPERTTELNHHDVGGEEGRVKIHIGILLIGPSAIPEYKCMVKKNSELYLLAQFLNNAQYCNPNGKKGSYGTIVKEKSARRRS